MQIILFISLIFSIGHIILLHRQLRAISEQLKAQSTVVRITLFDRTINRLALEINRMIKRNQEICNTASKSQKALKQSIADISHDFRTPLTAIIGYLQMFKEEQWETKHVDAALNRAKKLNQLVNRFYESILIDETGLQAEVVEVNLSNLLTEMLFNFTDDFEQRGIVPQMTGFDRPIFANVDISMLERVIQNIMSNCLKYAQNEVQFTLGQTDEAVFTIKNKIKDNISVDPYQVFDRFYTGSMARDSSGLGLYIVRLLIEAMGSKVTAQVCDNMFILNIHFQCQTYNNASKSDDIS